MSTPVRSTKGSDSIMKPSAAKNVGAKSLELFPIQIIEE
jgi:hypothetical protein